MPADVQPTVQSLDTNILHLEKEVNILLSRKAALKTSVLSHASTMSRLRAAANPRQREQLDELVAGQRVETITGAHQLYIGATLFDPKNDGPLKNSLHQVGNETVGKGQTMGVRLERYDKRAQKFLHPVYMILGPRDGPGYGDQQKDTSQASEDLLCLLDRPLQVVKHNLPAEIPLAAIEERHLLGRAYEDDNGDVGDVSGIDALRSRPLLCQAQFRIFVLDVQRRLIASARRYETLEMLVEETKWSQSVKKNYISTVQEAKATALDAREVEVLWYGGHVGRIGADDTGMMVHASVVHADGIPDEAAEMLVLQRHSLLELDTLEL